MKRPIDPDPPDWSEPYGHLLPVVDLLVTAGNRVLQEGFFKGSDGWRCELAEPLDFQLLRREFVFPESIRLVPERNQVHCRRTWTVIAGAVEVSAQRRLAGDQYSRVDTALVDLQTGDGFDFGGGSAAAAGDLVVVTGFQERTGDVAHAHSIVHTPGEHRTAAIEFLAGVQTVRVTPRV